MKVQRQVLMRLVLASLLVVAAVLSLNYYTQYTGPENPHLSPHGLSAGTSDPVSVVHVGVVATNFSRCWHVALLVKSVLLHRSSASLVHFHFLTTSDSRVVLEGMFNSWYLSHFTASFYDTETVSERYIKMYESSTRNFDGAAVEQHWILDEVLPRVHTVLVLQANTVVMQDVSIIWDRAQWEDVVSGSSEATTRSQVEAIIERGLPAALYEKNQQADSSYVYRAVTVHHSKQAQCKWLPGHGASGTESQVVSVLIGDLVNVIDHSEYLKSVLTFDGYNLQQDISHGCDRQRQCRSFCPQSFRVHPFYRGHQYQPLDKHDVTLVTQLSLDRLYMLKLILEKWDGPVSAAIYAMEAQALKLGACIDITTLFGRKNVAIHLVYAKKNTLYPTNFLRNIAWNYSTTPYVFLNDVDLIPAPHNYESIKYALRTFSFDRVAFVVPAFQTFIQDLQYPESKTVLKTYLEQQSVVPCKVAIFSPSHGPTDYDKWVNTTHLYFVRWSPRFEPYVVVPRTTTRYDERFVGYGKDKTSHIEELHAKHFSFVVLPEVYVIHYPHDVSSAERKFRGKASHTSHARGLYYKCILQLEQEFLGELQDKYGYVSVSLN